MQRLSLAQCHLEAAIGTIKKAAAVNEQRGNLETAVRLSQLAIEAAKLRDPVAVAILEDRRRKRVGTERASA